MDPNATLAEIRRLTKRNEEAPLDLADTNRLVLLLLSLDGWLTKGGFLPDAWKRAEQAGVHREIPG